MCAACVFLSSSWPSPLSSSFTLPARVLEPGPAQGFALFSYTTVAWSGFRLWVLTLGQSQPYQSTTSRSQWCKTTFFLTTVVTEMKICNQVIHTTIYFIISYINIFYYPYIFTPPSWSKPRVISKTRCFSFLSQIRFFCDKWNTNIYSVYLETN